MHYQTIQTTLRVIRYGFAAAVFAAAILVSSSGQASAAPRRPDLQTTMSAPANVSINTPTTYTVDVENIGDRRARAVSLLIDMPLTNTSPTVHILGDVSSVGSKCSIANNQISCDLHNIRPNRTKSISFDFAAPVANKPLTMTAVAAASNNEPNTGNNTASVTPNLVYPSRPITSTVTANNSHCTGTNLSAYYECQLYPSSISTHNAVLNNDPGKTITINVPGFGGTWSQPTPHQLQFEYTNTSGKVLEFSGYAINGGNCFDGITEFFQPVSTYNSAYRVCI